MDKHDLINAIGYQFQNPALLEQSLIHSSYINEHQMNPLENNERLEFLGDAVLELAISRAIYAQYPELSEGELTKLRASIVCEAMLSKKARALGLGNCLQMSKGESQTGGHDRDSTLCDAFEALLGAIYLDGGFDAAEDFAIAQLAVDIVTMRKAIWQSDCKTHLQEQLQKNSRAPIEYTVVAERGPDHDKIFVVELRHEGKTLGTGEGRNKKEAEQNAAASAIQTLGI